MFWLLILGIILYFVFRDSAGSRSEPPQDVLLQRIINRLVSTAQSEKDAAKSKATKDALQRVIDSGYEEQFGYVPNSGASQSQATTMLQEQHAQAVAPYLETQAFQAPPVAAKQPMDNTTLLLYFGAFLFMTSVGLFVAFADLDGTVRSILVALVAIAQYVFGFWIHTTKPKLKEAGVAFIGIGMAIVPFVGFAFYYYVFNESNGSVVWLLTSVIALGVYLFTLLKINNTFISYMLIASFVSVLQSAVGVIDGPVYYFVWMLIATGILFQALSLVSKKIPNLSDSSAQSSILLVPLGLIGSLFLVSSDGYLQLSVSLALAACYYGVMYFTQTQAKDAYVSAAHILLLSAISVGAFGVNESVTELGVALGFITLAHVVIMLTVSSLKSIAGNNFVNVGLGASAISMVVLIDAGQALVFAVLSAVLFGVVSTLKTSRYDIFVSTAILWVASSIALGQLLPEEPLSYLSQALLTFGFSLPFTALCLIPAFERLEQSRKDVLLGGISAAHFVSFVSASFNGGYAMFWFVGAAMLHMLLIAEYKKMVPLVSVIVAYSVAPIVYVVFALNDPELKSLPLFSISVLLAVAVNVCLSLRYKIESARLASTAAWLALPFALGIEEVGGFSLNADLQMWLYLAVAIVLSVSRAIARGRVMHPGGASLESLSSASSVTYEIGLWLAAVAAATLAFVSTQNVASSTLVVVLAGFVVAIGGVLIERIPQYLAILPIVFQIALIRLMEPYSGSSWIQDQEQYIQLFVAVSSLLAAVQYMWIASLKDEIYAKDYIQRLQEAVVSTAFIAPLSFLIVGEVVWMMPIALLVAVAILYHRMRFEDLATKESIIGVGVAGLCWLLAILGVENIHIYTHIVGAAFAVFAYVRFRSNDTITGQNYVITALSIVTIPLLLSGLYGNETSGLVLLLENIIFLIIGVTIKNEFVTRWGLYVAVGAVLYQLRGLGWAMLSVLGLFIIGIAMYRLLAQPDDQPPK